MTQRCQRMNSQCCASRAGCCSSKPLRRCAGCRRGQQLAWGTLPIFDLPRRKHMADVLILPATGSCLMQLAKEARRIGGGRLTPAVQQILVDKAFGCAALRAAPLAPTYQRRVLQGLMQAADEDGCELADPLVELFTAAQLVSFVCPLVSCWFVLVVALDQLQLSRHRFMVQDGRTDGEPSWRVTCGSACNAPVCACLHGDAIS